MNYRIAESLVKASSNAFEAKLCKLIPKTALMQDLLTGKKRVTPLLNSTIPTN